MYTEDVFAHISQGVKQREGWKRTRVFPLGDWVSYRRAVPHTPFCSAVSSPAQHTFAVTRWTRSLHSLWLLLFSPSKSLLSASTTPSISEVKFPISSVCWSSRILRWILYGKKLSALQDVVTYFLHSNSYSSMLIYTRLTYGCHLNENRSPLWRRCKCLSSRTHTHKTNGTEVATQSKKKFKVLCTATAPCTLLMFRPKQRSFGAPARCSGRSIAHPSTQLHPSAVPHRRQHLISLQGCPLGDVLRPERMLPATELLKKNQVEKVGFAF